MDALKLIVYKTPFIITTIILHVLGLGPNVKKWTVKEAVFITVLRDVVAGPQESVTVQQKKTTCDRPVRGSMWISKVTLPQPLEGDARHLLLESFRSLRLGNEELVVPSLAKVEAEWTSYRPNVSDKEPEPAISEEAKFQRLMEDTTNDSTVLYFHGGSYYLMDPATCRGIVSQYARGTGSRVLSVRYRLAPQNPFPAALLDGLVAYLSLLYPPSGSYHDPVPASKVVVAGDSAGGNLSLALLQTLLQAHRNATSESPKVKFHGKDVELPLPAGFVLGSPSLDLTHSLRTSELHASCDYLPRRGNMKATHPKCSVWPTNPPRDHMFCEGNTLCHPLVSPLAASSWEGAPPVAVLVGEEVAADECIIWARKAIAQGVKVRWEQYEAMPHCFWHLFAGSPATDRCFKGWSRFVTSVTGGSEGLDPGGAEFFFARTAESRSLQLEPLDETEHEEIIQGMFGARDELVERKRRDRDAVAN